MTGSPVACYWGCYSAGCDCVDYCCLVGLYIVSNCQVASSDHILDVVFQLSILFSVVSTVLVKGVIFRLWPGFVTHWGWPLPVFILVDVIDGSSWGIQGGVFMEHRIAWLVCF